MTTTRNAFRLAASAGLLSLAMFGANAQAAIEEVDPHGFSDLRQVIVKMREMPMKNKDATITKQEYLEMQGKMFDMAAKDGKMSMTQFKAFMNEFKTFGQ